MENLSVIQLNSEAPFVAAASLIVTSDTLALQNGGPGTATIKGQDGGVPVKQLGCLSGANDSNGGRYACAAAAAAATETQAAYLNDTLSTVKSVFERHNIGPSTVQISMATPGPDTTKLSLALGKRAPASDDARVSLETAAVSTPNGHGHAAHGGKCSHGGGHSHEHGYSISRGNGQGHAHKCEAGASTSAVLHGLPLKLKSASSFASDGEGVATINVV